MSLSIPTTVAGTISDTSAVFCSSRSSPSVSAACSKYTRTQVGLIGSEGSVPTVKTMVTGPSSAGPVAQEQLVVRLHWYLTYKHLLQMNVMVSLIWRDERQVGHRGQAALSLLISSSMRVMKVLRSRAIGRWRGLPERCKSSTCLTRKARLAAHSHTLGARRGARSACKRGRWVVVAVDEGKSAKSLSFGRKIGRNLSTR